MVRIVLIAWVQCLKSINFNLVNLNSKSLIYKYIFICTFYIYYKIYNNALSIYIHVYIICI